MTSRRYRRRTPRTSPEQAELEAWRTSHRREDVETSGLPLLVDIFDKKQRMMFEMVSRMSARDVEAVTGAQHDYNSAVEVISKSASGRGSVDVGRKLVRALNGRTLKHVDLVGLIIDGVEAGGDTMVWAIGITRDGTKVPLRVEHGETEKAVVVAKLLHNLEYKQHLDMTNALFVTDGHQSMKTPLKDKVVQLCVVHWARVVIERRLSVAERVAIGRRLVADHREALARGGEAAAKRRLRKVDKELLAKLEVAENDRRRTAKDKTKESADEEECLRAIGEDGVRRGLYRAWDRDEHSEAVAALKAEAAWLDHWGHPGAASSLRDGIKGTTTLQRIGVKDPQVRRILRQSNIIESAHGTVKELKKRVANWQDVAMRLRIVAIAIAQAELSWKLVIERSRLEVVPLAVARARYPDIGLGIERDDARPDTVALVRVAVKSGSEAKVDPALANLFGWADRDGKKIVVSERVLADLPPAPEWRQWLAERGFAPATEHGGALVRAPRADGHRRAGNVEVGRLGSAALSELRRAIDEDRRPLQAKREVPRRREAMGDDLRLLSGIAETAIGMVPAKLKLKADKLALEAAQLTAARHDLTTLKSDVDVWWEANWEDAAKEAAAQWGHAKQEERAPPRPFEGGRAWVLDQRQVDKLEVYARGHVAELVKGGSSKLAEFDRSAGALAGLDALVERFELAAGAVAAAQAIDLRGQIERALADAGTAGGVIEPGTYNAKALSPVDLYAGALGKRRTELLSGVGKAIAPLLKNENGDDAALVKLREEIGNPWRAANLNKAQAIRAVGLEEATPRSEKVERDEVLRDGYRASCNKAKGAKAEDVHNHFLEMLAKLEKQAADLRKADGSVDRFMIEHGPAAALHNAAEMEWRKRSLERMREAPSVDVGVGM